MASGNDTGVVMARAIIALLVVLSDRISAPAWSRNGSSTTVIDRRTSKTGTSIATSTCRIEIPDAAEPEEQSADEDVIVAVDQLDVVRFVGIPCWIVRARKVSPRMTAARHGYSVQGSRSLTDAEHEDKNEGDERAGQVQDDDRLSRRDRTKTTNEVRRSKKTAKTTSQVARPRLPLSEMPVQRGLASNSSAWAPDEHAQLTSSSTTSTSSEVHRRAHAHASAGSEVDVEDLMSAGLFGLMDAIDAFDLERGVKFETYCAQRIRGAIFDELRAMDWVPRLVRSRTAKVERARKALEMELRTSSRPMARSATD